MYKIREAKLSYKTKRCSTRVVISDPESIANLFRTIAPTMTQECFLVFHLDGANQIASVQVVSMGLANMATVHPREVFQGALVAGSVSIAVAHNHPSGVLNPSNQDKEVTERLVEAGKLLGVPVLDHVIVSDDSYYSFKYNGLM